MLKGLLGIFLFLSSFYANAKTIIINPNGHLIISEKFTAQETGDYIFPKGRHKLNYMFVNGKEIKKEDYIFNSGDNVKIKYIQFNPIETKNGVKKQSFLLKNNSDDTKLTICPNFKFKQSELSIYIDGEKIKIKDKCFRESIVKGATRKIDININSSIYQNTNKKKLAINESFPQIYNDFEVNDEQHINNFIRHKKGTITFLTIIKKDYVNRVIRLSYLGEDDVKDEVILSIPKFILKDKKQKILDIEIIANNKPIKFKKIEKEKVVKLRFFPPKNRILNDLFIIYKEKNAVIKRKNLFLINDKDIVVNEGIQEAKLMPYISIAFVGKSLETFKEAKYLNEGFKIEIKSNAVILTKKSKFSPQKIRIEGSFKDIRIKESELTHPHSVLSKNWASILLSLYIALLGIYILFIKERKKTLNKSRNRKFNYDLSIEEIRYMDNKGKYTPSIYNMLLSINLKGYINVKFKNSKIHIKKTYSSVFLTKVEDWFIKKLFKNNEEIVLEINNPRRTRQIFQFYIENATDVMDQYLNKFIRKLSDFKKELYVLLSITIGIYTAWMIVALEYLSPLEIALPYVLLIITLILFKTMEDYYVSDVEVRKEIDLYKIILIESKTYVMKEDVPNLSSIPYKRLMNYIIIFETNGKGELLVKEIYKKVPQDKRDNLFFKELENKIIKNILLKAYK